MTVFQRQKRYFGEQEKYDKKKKRRWHMNAKNASFALKIYKTHAQTYDGISSFFFVGPNMRQHSIAVANPISRSCTVCVLRVQRCGWQSGIRSGSVSVLECGAADVQSSNNAILCFSLGWPILGLAEWEESHSIMCVLTAGWKQAI